MSRQLKRVFIGGAVAVALAVSGGTAVAATGGGNLEAVAEAVHLRAAKPKPAALTFAANPLVGGKKTTATIKLTAAAPAGGVKVALTSKNAAFVKVPTFVKVKAGQKTAKFTVTTKTTAKKRAVAITAALNGKKLVKKLTLRPKIWVASLAFGNAAPVGGTVVTATVGLNAAAPAAGRTVLLTSGSYLAEVPYSVKIAAGAKKATFKITTNGVNAATGVKIGVSLGGVKLSKTLTVMPDDCVNAANPAGYALTEFHLHFDAIVDSSIGRAEGLVGNIDIDKPAPNCGITIQLSSTLPGNLTFNNGGKAVVPAGQTTARFWMGYTEVQVLTPFQVIAALNGQTLNSIERNLGPKGMGN
ncbi:hypothetical protein GCM10022221_01830 [Actinocorallia aurea]